MQCNTLGNFLEIYHETIHVVFLIKLPLCIVQVFFGNLINFIW